MTRSNAREIAVHLSFALGFSDQTAEELDGYISKYAIGWSFSRISRMTAAVMRVAMYEILYMPDIPAAAAINEAVELARRYDAPEAASFANGILGAFVRGELPPEQADAVDTQAEDKKDGV